MGGKRTRAQHNRARQTDREAQRGPAVAIPRYEMPDQLNIAGSGKATILVKPAVNLRSELVANADDGSYAEGLSGYKYLPHKYVASLLAGSTRIGTLHDYRREELGHGIADPNEGRKRLHHQRPQTRVVAGTPEGDAMKHMGFNLKGDSVLELNGINITREVDHPDVFVWCCARVLDAEIMQGLAGAEACVEIADLGAFVRCMTTAINAARPVKFLGMREIEYLPLDQPWNGVDLGLSAAFSKEPSAYGAQREIRAIWAPYDDDPIAPFILQSDDLTGFCKEVHVAR